MARNTLQIAFRLIVLVLVVLLAFALADLASESEAISGLVAEYGYIGIFLISLLSGFNLVVPIPAVAFLPLFLESGLSYWPTILIITLGVTAADILAYFLTRAGRDIVSLTRGEKVFEKINVLREKYPHSPLIILFFFASFVPVPNEILLVPMAFFGYSFGKLMPVVLVGNFIFTLLYAQGALEVFKIF